MTPAWVHVMNSHLIPSTELMSFVPLWVAVILNSCIVFDDRMKVVITTGYPLLTNRIKAVMGKMSNACLFIIVTFGNTKSVHV